jgi:hypothetical protein
VLASGEDDPLAAVVSAALGSYDFCLDHAEDARLLTLFRREDFLSADLAGEPHEELVHLTTLPWERRARQPGGSLDALLARRSIWCWPRPSMFRTDSRVRIWKQGPRRRPSAVSAFQMRYEQCCAEASVGESGIVDAWAQVPNGRARARRRPWRIAAATRRGRGGRAIRAPGRSSSHLD